MILDSPIDVQDSKERVLFDISGKRIVDTVNYPLEKLRINVLADCFSSKIGLKRKNIGYNLKQGYQGEPQSIEITSL